MKKLLGNLFFGVVVLAVLAACDARDKSTSGDNVATTTSPEKSVESAQQPMPGLVAPFSEDLPSIAVGGYCSLDAVNGNAVADGRVELKRGAPAVVGGWATTLAGAVPAEPLLVVHNESGSYAVKLATGVSRPDVAAALKNAALANAGYESPAALKDVPTGSYDLSVVTQADTDTRHRCPLNVVLTLTD